MNTVYPQSNLGSKKGIKFHKKQSGPVKLNCMSSLTKPSCIYLAHIFYLDRTSGISQIWEEDRAHTS